mmetsp:Transcript_15772/g.24534  ORF Transcript_15772/g.24534 Transcript_15772/m.24534 type:complete len:449 (+) Transcript_15772:31-1377(+)
MRFLGLTRKAYLLLFSALSVANIAITSVAADDLPELVLDERVLNMSLIAANLSSLAYLPSMDFAVLDEDGNVTGYEHPDYEEITFYNDEPDQAVVAKKEGRCYLAFRGTNPDFDDWLQNANTDDRNICKDNNASSTECCETRAGFADFLDTEPVIRGRADLQTCLDKTCTEETKDDCLVLTGHSQGGATAAVASITLFSERPTVITFGQPPTLDAGCDLIPSEKYYRYVNSMQNLGEEDDMGFDAVVFAPNWISGSVHYGYFIMLGEDPAAVTYLGYDQNYDFAPTLNDYNVFAHTIDGAKPYGYESRMSNLLTSFPHIQTNGSSVGTICEEGSYAQLCESNLCVEHKCLPVGGVQELCVKGSCEKDDDCAGDHVCIWDACATASGEVQNECPCRFDDQCASGECTFPLTSLDRVCTGSAASGVWASFRPVVVTATMVNMAGILWMFV